MTREPDLVFEAIEKVTNANRDMERGRLNTAAAAIRRASQREGIAEEDLPREVELRAAAYRAKWPQLTLTPTALATHWYRVVAEVSQTRSAQEQALDELRRGEQ